MGGLAKGGAGLGRAPTTKLVATEKGLTTIDGRKHVYTAMQFRSLEKAKGGWSLSSSRAAQSRGKLAITCRGQIGDRELEMFTYQKATSAFCLAPLRRGESGRVTISMSVKTGTQRFAKTFRGVIQAT
jgi:hypothetical protein